MAMVERGLVLLSLCVVSSLTVGVSAATIPSVSVIQSLVPAFVWSNHGLLDSDTRRISYQTLTSEDLAETVKHEFVWRPTSGSVEQQKKQQDVDDLVVGGMDVVMAFIGTKLRSEDVSRQGGRNRASDLLLQVLNTAVTSSNSSVSLPYVRPPRDGGSLADVLLSAIVSDLEEDGESRLGEVIIAGACVYKSTPRTKTLPTVDALKEYLSGRKGTKAAGKTDLVLVCSRSEVESLGSKSMSEGEILSDVLWGLDELKTHYVALYATDLPNEKALPSRPRGRQLGAVVYENEEYCNEVCQTKASLLEGLFVGLTLVIILLSGLCCMAGITSPTRFEQAKDGGQ